MKTRRKMKAWLVTWEWIGDHAKRDKTIAAVFNPRLGSARVQEFVEFLYLTEYYSLSEQMAIAQHKAQAQNPYPAQFVTGSEMYCGHNPFLHAQLVDDLTVECDANSRDIKATWKTRSSGRRKSVALTREVRHK
jgi:hypothetical protein